MQIDLTEIPPANKADGNQDTFELFARDLLDALDFRIITDVGRGNDDRKDIIISETIKSKISSYEKRYLVSCKHNAHSSKHKAVGNSDEPDILGRLRLHKCDGFIGFYSTIPSSSLIREIENLKNNFSAENKTYDFIDKSKILSFLSKNESTLKIFNKYLPKSFISYTKNNINSGIYNTEPKIHCHNCRCNILTALDGNVIKIQYYTRAYNYSIGRETGTYALHDIIFSCNECKDKVVEFLKSKYSREYEIYWKNIIDYTNPNIFLDNTMEDVKLSFFYAQHFIDIDIFRKWHIFTRSMFYYVSRKHENKKTTKSFLDIDLHKYEL